MKFAIRITIITLLSLAFLSSFSLTSTGAREQQGRKIRLVVGSSEEEVKSGASKTANLWAVIIGVSNYLYGEQEGKGGMIRNLNNAADDAQAVYDFLRSQEGGGFRDVSEGGHMVLLKDERATKANIENALDRLKNADEKDYFVVFIAAHGMLGREYDRTTNTAKEIPYFVLYDTNLQSPQSTALRMERFQKAVRDTPARKGLILSDTCHSGGMQLVSPDGRSARDINNSARANGKFWDEMNKVASGIGFISASGEMEEALEDDNLGQGIFTHCLLNGLRGNADKDQDSAVTFSEITDYLRTEVPRLTSDAQHPKFNVSEIAANRIPLSVVPYSAEIAGEGSGGYGVLVIRTPDIDGVNVAIDGKTTLTLDSKRERTIRVPTGKRSLLFNLGSMKRPLDANVSLGETKIVEVNLTFSRGDDNGLVDPTQLQETVFLSGDQDPSDEANRIFQNGVDSLNKQRPEEAIELFNKAIQTNGRPFADALVYLGRAQQRIGQYAAAERSFSKAVQLRPSDYTARALRAEAIYRSAGNIQEAIQELKSIIARHPNDDFSRVVYGNILLSRRDFRNAEILLRKAVAIRPKSPPAHMILADALAWQDSHDKHKEAIKEAKKALELLDELSEKQRSVARALKGFSLSHLLFGGGRYTNDESMAEAHYILAKSIYCFVGLSDNPPPNRDALLEEARVNLQKTLDLARGISNKERLLLALDISARISFLRAEFPKAIKDAEEAIKLSDSTEQLKGFAEPHFTLYTVYNNEQKFPKAAENLEKFITKKRADLSPEELENWKAELDRIKGLANANRRK